MEKIEMSINIPGHGGRHVEMELACGLLHDTPIEISELSRRDVVKTFTDVLAACMADAVCRGLIK